MGSWETDSDNDLSGTGITALDCYDSQAHDDTLALMGATGLDSTHYREVRSASACSTPYAGKAATGCNIESTNSIGNCITLSEDWHRFRDMVVKLTNNHATGGNHYSTVSVTSNNNTKLLNCVIHDSTNDGAGGEPYGIYSDQDNHLIYNCIIYGCGYDGVRLRNAFSGSTNPNAAICCTSVNNGTYGFYSDLTSIFGEQNWVWSCYAADNTTADFLDTAAKWSSPSGWNSSDDTTSDLGGTAGNNYKNSNDLITGGELDSDYLPTQSISWAGGAGDNAGRNPYNDLTATYDFNDFFKNDAAGEGISKDDIRGEDRYDPDTADTAWDVGAGEYVSAPPSGAGETVYVAT